MEPLSDSKIRQEIGRAWQESDADEVEHRHEEGGYIVRSANGAFAVERWPRGEQGRIVPPALDADNRYCGRIVVATFHTHPNPAVDENGQEWEQEPSESDRRWHKRRGLRGFVVSCDFVFEIDVDGTVSVCGRRAEVLLP